MKEPVSQHRNGDARGKKTQPPQRATISSDLAFIGVASKYCHAYGAVVYPINLGTALGAHNGPTINANPHSGTFRVVTARRLTQNHRRTIANALEKCPAVICMQLWVVNERVGV